MNKTTYVILILFLSVSRIVCAADFPGAQSKSSMIEGEMLRYQSVELTSEGYTIKDKDLLQASTESLYAYVTKSKKPERRYWMMLAENYYVQKKYSDAEAIYRANLGDGLSHLRLGEIIFSSNDPNADYGKAVYHYNQGMTISSSLIDEYTQAVKQASEQLPLFFFQRGDDENARKYHRAFTHESEAKTARWIYRLYVQDNKFDKAIQYAKIASKLEPDSAINYELIAICYFSLTQHEQAFPYWSKAASLGSAIGHIRLGQAYATGSGCAPDDSQAITHFEEGLKTLKWKWAQKMLAGLYQKGDTTNPNFNLGRAHYWLSQCAAAGDWSAKGKLAESLAYWGRKETDKVKRQEMLNQANILALEVASRNPKDKSAWFVLGSYLGDSLLAQPKVDLKVLKDKRRYLAVNKERDMQVCRLLADGGYVDEIVQLAKAYTTGKYEYSDLYARHSETTDVNTDLAFQYWQKGLNADPHNVACITAVTDAYTYGRGVKQDIDQAKKIWESHGMYNYASTYFYPWHTWKIQRGDIGEVIYMFNYYNPARLNMSGDEAIKWLRNAANNGNKDQRTVALYLLGESFESGKLVPVNYEQALSYYKQSAQMNNANANRRLGQIYKNGECGVNMSYSTAAQYFQRCHQITNTQEDYWQYIECNNAANR